MNGWTDRWGAMFSAGPSKGHITIAANNLTVLHKNAIY